MKTKILAILLILFIGLAGAVTIPSPTYNFGPSAGFKNPATIQASDLYATDDFKAGDDVQVLGDFALTGTANLGSAITTTSTIKAGGTGTFANLVSNGTLTVGTTSNLIGAITATSTGKFGGTITGANLASNGTLVSTGATNLKSTVTTTSTVKTGGTVTGANLASNGTLVASGATNLVGAVTTTSTAKMGGELMAASGVFNGTVDINGATTTENITMTQNKRLVFNTAGTGYISWLDSGNYMTIKGNPQFDDGFTWSGTASPASGSDLNALGGASDINYTLSSGILVTPTGAATHQGTTTFSKTVNYAVNASTTASTTLTSSSTKTIYGINASAANVTLTLPDAATVSGREFKIATDADPGSYYVKITATGSDKIGGAGGFTIAQTTDANAGMTVVSDGTRYLLVGAYGTWAEGTA